jgi:putative NADH-flavin reductase
MNITIFGASRGVGKALVDTAAAGGHTVTAVARRAVAFNGMTGRAIVGDVLADGLVPQALEGADAVVIALGTAPAEKGPTAQAQVCSRATRSILAAMAGSTVRRVLVVTSYGVGPTRANRPFPFNIVAATLLRDVMADKELQEQLVRDSIMEWTIAQPLGLTDDPATGTPMVSTDGSRGGSRVARADVAAVCLDAIVTQRYIRESIAISARS